MKKLTKKTRSALLNGLIIFLTIAVVFYLGARNGNINDAWNALRSAKTNWVLAALACWCAFVLLECWGVQLFFIQQRVKIRFRSTLLVSLIGMFYSNVTPGASGGQPMQVFSFRKYGVPPGVASSALAVKFFCFQASMLLLGAVLWIFNPGAVNRYITGGKFVVIAGFFLSGFSITAILLLAVNKNIVRSIIGFIIRVLVKLRLVRHQDKAESLMEKVIQDFHASVDMIKNHPLQLLELMVPAFFQVLGYMSMAYCVYRAMGMRGIPFHQILTLQTLLYIGASFMPLPGSSGAQEGGFYLFFQNIYPADKLLGALLLWRFFTYYLALIVGLAAVVVNSAMNLRGRKAAPNENGEGGNTVAQEAAGADRHFSSDTPQDHQEAQGKDQ